MAQVTPAPGDGAAWAEQLHEGIFWDEVEEPSLGHGLCPQPVGRMDSSGLNETR